MRRNHVPSKMTTRKKLEEGVQVRLGAIELFSKTIPEYEVPKILENGDIISRLKKSTVSEPKIKTEYKCFL